MGTLRRVGRWTAHRPRESRGLMSQTTGSDGELAPEIDRQILHEVGQVIRALEANGPCTEEEHLLAQAVLAVAPFLTSWIERNPEYADRVTPVVFSISISPTTSASSLPIAATILA